MEDVGSIHLERDGLLDVRAAGGGVLRPGELPGRCQFRDKGRLIAGRRQPGVQGRVDQPRPRDSGQPGLAVEPAAQIHVAALVLLDGVDRRGTIGVNEPRPDDGPRLVELDHKADLSCRAKGAGDVNVGFADLDVSDREVFRSQLGSGKGVERRGVRRRNGHQPALGPQPTAAPAHPRQHQVVRLAGRLRDR